MSNWNISSCANDFICKNHKDEDIISASEVVSYDGNDSFGPKSYLYDLFVVIKDSNMSGIYKYYFYHRENWFNGKKEEEMYFLENKIKTFVVMKINNLDDWKYLLEKC